MSSQGTYTEFSSSDYSDYDQTNGPILSAIKMGIMPSSINATKTNTTPSLNAVAPTLVARAIDTTNASTLHAVTSPTAAQAVAVRPSEVLKIARSCKIRSRTGKAVILMEIPMKRAKPVNDAPG